MTMDFAETLQVGDVTYETYEFPLNAYLDLLSPRPRLPCWPGCSNGYYGAWEVQDRPEGRFLCMVELRPRANELLALLFPRSEFPMPATWFSGVVRAVRDERRRTGYPPRTFWNEEIFLEVVAGEVMREWVLDLRMVPDQTSEEFRLSVPAFLLKPVSE
jgi:hypothetical protein